LLRGFKANVAIENLVLEINSSKFAYNMSFKEVTSGICKGVLSIAPRVNSDFSEKPAKVQWEKTKEAILKLKGVFANYVKTMEHQMDLLGAIEEYANDNPQYRPLLMQTFHLLYDEEILTEDAILKWHKHSSLYEAGAELRKLVTKLIDWLEASDSESGDEEE
jgi:translation initiation factor eIF-2B subunit epsilon